jgi:hypothetical protein
LVTFSKSPDSEPIDVERFQLTAVDESQLRAASYDEVEDEACSMGMFVAFSNKVDVNAQIVVSHPEFGHFVFKPDYEGDHLVGLMKDDRSPLASAA